MYKTTFKYPGGLHQQLTLQQKKKCFIKEVKKHRNILANPEHSFDYLWPFHPSRGDRRRDAQNKTFFKPFDVFVEIRFCLWSVANTLPK